MFSSLSWKQQSRSRFLNCVFLLTFFVLVSLSGCDRGDSKANESSEAIHSVLEADGTTVFGVSSTAEIAQRMRAIDLSKCPNDFAAAYVAHIHAWERRAELENARYAYLSQLETSGAVIDSLIRGLGDPFGPAKDYIAARDKFTADFNDVQKEIMQTFQRVEEIAAANGITLPPKDPVSHLRAEDMQLFPVITSVNQGSIAASVGIRPGDILLAYNGVLLHLETKKNNELGRAIVAANGQPKVQVKLYRDRRLVVVEVPGGKLLGIEFRVAR